MKFDYIVDIDFGLRMVISNLRHFLRNVQVLFVAQDCRHKETLVRSGKTSIALTSHLLYV